MKYWTYMNGEVPGSYEPEALAALRGFTMTTLVCPGEGEIAEKNWRRAGEFDDIVQALEKQQAAIPPSAPLGAPPAFNEVDALLDTASTRLFSHVADLMKELETRRDEKSLIVSLQRQISALKAELSSAREAATLLEIRIPRISELEETIKKDHAALAQLQLNLTAKDNQFDEMRRTYERMRGDLEGSKRRVQETENDLGIRNRLVDKLSKDLSDKELSLAKALGVIRRLEEDLNRLCPSPEMLKPAAAPAPVQPTPVRAAPPPSPAPEAALPALPASRVVEPNVVKVFSVPEFKTNITPPPAGSFTNDDPPPPPAYIEPQFPTKAHEALMGFLRKVFPGQSQ